MWIQTPEKVRLAPKAYPKYMPRSSGWIGIRWRQTYPGVDQIADTLKAKLDTMGFASCEVKCLVAKVLT